MNIKLVLTSILLFVVTSCLFANKPYRVGTTAANFLEMGIGSSAGAMGDAYVAVTRDLNSVYWNPAGLAYMDAKEVQFSYQPWIADINVEFAGAGIVLPRIGTLALSVSSMNYGRTEVTTLDMQEGTGETYQAVEYAATLSYARKLAQWFSFGSSVKYVASNIWHMKAQAMALDLGVLINTYFFSPTKNREDGMTIGMSIANYGTRMRYDGMDLLRPIDILPNQNGNYKDVEGQFRLQQWELPLTLRLGVAGYPVVTKSQRLTLAVDALHPNNNCESVNVGAEYGYLVPGVGRFILRTGYRGLFMEESFYGMTFGAGMHLTLLGNRQLKFDYAVKDLGLLGYSSVFNIGLVF